MAEQRVVMVSPEQHAREQLARELEELKKNPLDRATRPGGEYLVDGKRVDAHGKAIQEEAAEAKEADELPTVAELEQHLAGMTDVAAITAMQARDERKSAAKLYEARLAQLEKPQG